MENSREKSLITILVAAGICLVLALISTSEPNPQPPTKGDDKKHPRCLECDKPACWVRMTQFAGNHPFCDEHARKEENFGKEDPSYFFWKKL